MPKDKKVDWNNYIFGHCPICDAAAYHKIKKSMLVLVPFDSDRSIELRKDRIRVYKCTKCKEKWGMN